MENETPTLDQTMDADLEALLGPSDKSKPAAPAAAASKSGETSEKVASPSSEETGDEDPLLKALESLDEEDGEKKEASEEGDEEAKPNLSSDQQAVLEAIPDIETATNLYSVVRNYNTFTTALAEGKFEDVESMLGDWNPDVIEKWTEYIYKKHGESFVDRFINENDPNAPKENKDIVALRKTVTALQEAISEKKKTNVQQTEAEKQQSSFQAYNKTVDAWFDKIEFSKNDRRWVTADLNQRIAADPKVLAAIKGGDPKAAKALFKTACKDYINRDKEVSEDTTKKITVQSKKKLPMGGGASEVVGEVPDDIRAVKKGEEDKWLDKALTGFLGKVLGGKK